tara:strand:- start:72 stop:389 length:318 start_codon:yes stop_codon:yes gene_type:complete
MRTCNNCSKSVRRILFNYKYKSCLKCLEKERFVMEVEFDTDPNDNSSIGFNVITDSSIEGLISRFKRSKTKKWDSYLGSCPNLKIKKVEDVLYNKDITHIFYKGI